MEYHEYYFEDLGLCHVDFSDNSRLSERWQRADGLMSVFKGKEDKADELGEGNLLDSL